MIESDESLADSVEPGASNVAALPLTIPPSTAGAPWELDVSQFPKVQLQNSSDQTQRYLPDSLIQQSRLHLFDQSGNAIVPFDNRARMKFDNRIWKDSYLSLDPGQSAEFNATRTFDDAEYPVIRHGSLRFEVRPHSTYRGYIEWRSEHNDYITKSGQQGNHGNVWLGTVYSEAVVLQTR